jgi:oleate hydratase
LAISEKAGRKQIEKILCQGGEIDVSPKDHVIVTLGSMTESSSLGSTDSAPIVKDKPIEASWSLWEKLAASHPELGRPSVFSSHVDESKWLSFTTTLHDPAFFQTVRDFTGNVPGEGGLITLADSPWLMSIVLPHQPHFIGQPDGVNVFWGYGLFIDRPGNFVRKPMSACTGREIMTELLCHFEVGASASRIMETATCIPCFMPFITSQFLRREKGDRPEIIPDGWDNFAVTGQFCEQPDDVVFTVEYSVRAAQTAVYKLLGLNREPPPVFKGQYNPRTIFEAFLALHDYAL